MPRKGRLLGADGSIQFSEIQPGFSCAGAMYQQDWSGVLTALNGSFLDIAGSVTTGPVFEYSTAPGNHVNTLWHLHDPTEDGEDNGAPNVIFDEYVSDAEAGDNRLSKVGLRFAPRQSGVVTSAYEAILYAFNVSPISIIRNEELILMSAEAKIQTNDFIGAADALNKIRASAGLQPLAIAKPGVDTKDEYIDESLNQRRYSLFWEGHRWFDMRRYNKLNALPLQGTVDGNTYTVFTRFSRPDSEIQWDLANPN